MYVCKCEEAFEMLTVKFDKPTTSMSRTQLQTWFKESREDVNDDAWLGCIELFNNR